MAVNESRSMGADFHQGTVDNTYMQVDPDRGGQPTVGKLERLTWPTYGQAELHKDHPFWEAMANRAPLPRERKVRGNTGDPRY